MNDAALLQRDLPTSPLVIRREELHVRQEARSIVAEAEKEAEAIREALRAEVAEERAAGHEEGVAAGRAEAARLIAEAAVTVDKFLSDRESELTELALAVAHRLIGELPEPERLARLARAAIAEHRGDVRLTLRVAATSAPALQAAVSRFDPAGRVHIEADPEAPPGSCTLVHPRGRVSIGLLDQFRALMATMKPAAGGRS